MIDTEICSNVVNERLSEVISRFCDVLKSNYKYNISVDIILTAINCVGESDVFDKNSLKMTLKTIVCKSQGDYEEFDEIFDRFFSKESLRIFNSTIESVKNEEYNKIKKGIAELVDENEIKVKDKSTQEDRFKEYEDRIREYIIQTQIGESEVSDLINVCRQDMSSINELVCKNVLHKDERLDKVKKNLEKIMIISMRDSKETSRYLIECATVLSKELVRIKGIVDKQNKALNSQMKEIEKSMSKIHREEYICGKNAVRLCSDILEENITSLSEADVIKLSSYIKQNAYRFKTKIAMNMKKSQNKRVDFKATVKKSIKSDGVPFSIQHKKPIPTKTKIVTICDVSGSCIQSARMLLNFLYELQSVFPGGCESFVFVADIAEVTSAFKKYSTNEACNYAVQAVPRRYSDYGKALVDFENQYMSRLGKDTIVIFLGDARNNKNDAREDVLLRMSKKVRKMFWLDTEPQQEWDKDDSVIYQYSKYMDKVYEVTKPQDIIDFLCSVG